MKQITKERAKEIIETYKEKKDLFNWCEEYDQFIRDGVSCCVSTEWDYMLRKSFEDSESPVNYEDLDLSDIDQLREEILYKVEKDYDEEELKELRENISLVKSQGGYLDITEEESIKEFIEGLSDEELKDLNEDIFNLEIPELEIYEWWIIQDNLKYYLEQQGEVFLSGAWGRCTTGQSISLDYCCITAFITYLKSLYDLE